MLHMSKRQGHRAAQEGSRVKFLVDGLFLCS
jgi:hypothetical protein